MVRTFRKRRCALRNVKLFNYHFSFNDNGSGVAALLEIARLISGANDVTEGCRTRNSLIVVAFDMEEMGNQGSLEFVHRFLVPKVSKGIE